MTRPTPHTVLLGFGLLLVAAAGAWLFLVRSDGDEETASEQPRLLSPSELSEFAGSAELPVFWAGRQGNTGLELTAEADGTSFIRYLPPDVDAGDPRPGFLTVATYPVEDSEGRLAAARKRKGAIVLKTPNGETAISNESSPTSVYLSPGSGLQVEVYDPSAQRAVEIIRSGTIQPVP